MPQSTSSSGRPRRDRVCVISAGWPQLSMTFVAQELVGLESEGLKLWLATYGRANKVNRGIHGRLQAPVHRLPRKPSRSPRLLRAWWKLRGRPGYKRARDLLKSGALGGRKKGARKAFARAMILAAEMPDDVGLIYSHFIDAPTSLALYAAMMLDLPLAISAHARDIWLSSETDLQTKLASARWCATCTEPGAEHLRGLADDPEKVKLIYHGLSFDRFPDPPARESTADGADPANPVRLLSVGRAVEKKGFDVLLAALAELPPGLNWRWLHIGTGRLVEQLQARAAQLGLTDRIEWLGARDQDYVIARYRDCDLFVLPSREAQDGDRDGLPNVLMEAQSQALACLSTRFSAIPELIIDGETGVMVEPDDRAALATALERLIRAPEERQRLGEAGNARVRQHFDSGRGIRAIAALLRQDMAAD